MFLRLGLFLLRNFKLSPAASGKDRAESWRDDVQKAQDPGEMHVLDRSEPLRAAPRINEPILEQPDSLFPRSLDLVLDVFPPLAFGDGELRCFNDHREDCRSLLIQVFFAFAFEEPHP